MSRFNPYPKTFSQYGAPMGRCDTRHDFTDAVNLCARPAYEYDSGGAYWGLPYNGSGPVWAVWERGNGQEGVAYVRAPSKTKAFNQVKEG